MNVYAYGIEPPPDMQLSLPGLDRHYRMIGGDLYEVLPGIPQIIIGPINRRRPIGPQRACMRGLLL